MKLSKTQQRYADYFKTNYNLDQDISLAVYDYADTLHFKVTSKKELLDRILIGAEKIGIVYTKSQDIFDVILKRRKFFEENGSIRPLGFYMLFARDGDSYDQDVVKIKEYYNTVVEAKSEFKTEFNNNNKDVITFTKEKFIAKRGIEGYNKKLESAMKSYETNLKHLGPKNKKYYTDKYGVEKGTEVYDNMILKRTNNPNYINADKTQQYHNFIERHGELMGFDKWKSMINSRNIVSITADCFEDITRNDLSNYISIYVNRHAGNNNFAHITPNNYNVVLPPTLFSAFDSELIDELLEELGVGKIDNEHIVKNANGIYNMYTKNNTCLLSYNEIKFYTLLTEHFGLVEDVDFTINKQYPNSTLHYDFELYGTFIEICCGFKNLDEYKEKMEFKHNQFGSILLWKNTEYKEIIEDIIEKNKNKNQRVA